LNYIKYVYEYLKIQNEKEAMKRFDSILLSPIPARPFPQYLTCALAIFHLTFPPEFGLEPLTVFLVIWNSMVYTQ